MITFKQFLTETVVASHDPEEAAKLVFKNCQPFLKESGFDISSSDTAHPKNALYRGMRGIAPDGLSHWDATRIRGPKDSSKDMHELLDDHLIRNFNYPYRSKGVFCTAVASTASSYGRVNLIFPIGDYKYVWSPIIEDAYIAFDHGGFPKMQDVIFEDMHTELHDEFMQDWREDDGEPSDKHFKDFLNTKTFMNDRHAWFDLVDKWLDQHGPYQDHGLKNLLKLDQWDGGKSELMLQCKDYYTVMSNGPADITAGFPNEFAHHLNLLMKGKKE